MVGSVISVYGTGFGQTDPPGLTGEVYPLEPGPLQTAASQVLFVSVGGAYADILYAGAAPGQLAGVNQINVRVPMPAAQAGSTTYMVVNSAVQDPVVANVYVSVTSGPPPPRH